MVFRTKVSIASAAVAALAIAAWALWRIAAGPSVDAYAVERRDLVQTVVASGRVQSPRRVEIASSLTGTVASVPVAEGQEVAAGQLLVALDDTEARAAVEQARFALAQAQAKLDQLHSTASPVAAEAARQAEVNLANAERTLDRTKELFAKGFVGQAALDDAQRNRDVAASQAKSAELQRASVSDGGMDERLARAALAQAKAALRMAEARLEYMTIEAPVAGRLISRSVEQGNVVQPGKVLMLLSPAGETQLVVQIDEKNLGLLREGQKALASADAYATGRFPAEVAYINPGVDPSRGSVEVKLTVKDPPAYLIQDMTVSVDIEVARRSAVLAIPSDAMREGNWVMVARGGRAVRQPIEVGARGNGFVEVVSGLHEGELVIAGGPAGVHEGEALRAQATPAVPTRRS